MGGLTGEEGSKEERKTKTLEKETLGREKTQKCWRMGKD